jgi:hypothetical protein
MTWTQQQRDTWVVDTPSRYQCSGGAVYANSFGWHADAVVSTGRAFPMMGFKMPLNTPVAIGMQPGMIFYNQVSEQSYKIFYEAPESQKVSHLVLIIQNIFEDCRSAYGGALALMDFKGEYYVKNNEFRRNLAYVEGGAIWAQRISDGLTLDGNKFLETGAQTTGGALFALVGTTFKFINGNEFIKCFSPCYPLGMAFTTEKPWTWDPFVEPMNGVSFENDFDDFYVTTMCGRGGYFLAADFTIDKCAKGTYTRASPIFGDAGLSFKDGFKGCPNYCPPGFYKDNEKVESHCNTKCPQGHM